MLRHIFPTLMLISLLLQGACAQAALSPEAQEEKEKSAIRESKALQGHSIRSMFLYEENGTRYYEVEADCIYKYVVAYPVSFLAVLGLVGPQKFTVKLDGQPNCQDAVAVQPEQSDLQIQILDYISEIYEVAVSEVKSNMSLYHVPTNNEKLAMDFRIMVLRSGLEKQVNCHIETDVFMTIRTVGDLLAATEKHCRSSK